MSHKKQLTLAWLGSLLTMVLMALPLGVPLTYSPDGVEMHTRLYAYFHPAVWGMSGNILPFAASLLAAVPALLLTLRRFGKNPSLMLAKYTAEISLVAVMYSLLIYRTFSVVGCIIVLIQLMVCGLLISLTPKKQIKSLK